jgi:hypothetical protein
LSSGALSSGALSSDLAESCIYIELYIYIEPHAARRMLTTIARNIRVLVAALTRFSSESVRFSLVLLHALAVAQQSTATLRTIRLSYRSETLSFCLAGALTHALV